mmetsp:Transcript_28917/g.55370  ORF Transcript_28917/g.55370 Transcript_28917/m.55370 type:complete len:120 (+) Transcript_28917:282-641(+)
MVLAVAFHNFHRDDLHCDDALLVGALHVPLPDYQIHHTAREVAFLLGESSSRGLPVEAHPGHEVLEVDASSCGAADLAPGGAWILDAHLASLHLAGRSSLLALDLQAQAEPSYLLPAAL